MPLVVLEALQHGVPVIASWTGGIPEVIRHGSNGLLVPPGDEVALAGTLDASFMTPRCEGASAPEPGQVLTTAFRLRVSSQEFGG